MKIFKILLVTAIAFGMMACNNEDVPQVIDGPEATISVKVFPSSNSPGLRSVGDLSDPNATTSPGLEAESTIHELEVWVFNGEVLTGYGSADGAEVTDIEAIAGESTVVVVANAGIGIIASKADLLAEVKELPVSDITAGGLVMTAEPIDVTLAAGQNQFGYPVTTGINNLSTALLPIVRVNARVALVGATVNYAAIPETQLAVFNNLRDVEVAMFNVPKETNLFGTSLATNDDFQYGQQWPSPELSYVGVNDEPAAPNALLDEAPLTLPAFTPAVPPTTVQTLISKTSAPYFYVNENTSEVVGDKETIASEKMIIVLRAKPYMGETAVTLEGLYTDAEGYTYYPVWVNDPAYTYDEGYVADNRVLRNTQYNISLTINGLGRPTIDEVDEAWLDVKVKVKAWDVVNQNVTWGTPVTPAP